MNREKYSKRFLSVVDIIAAFFTDTFINDLYFHALQKTRASDAPSVTDEYKRILMQYSYGVTNNSGNCKAVVSNLHKYYCDNTCYSAITYIQFEDDILKQFVPTEYYTDFTNKDKTTTMAALVIKTVQDAVVFILQPRVLRMVIDERADSAHVIMIQDHVGESLVMQREELYLDFAKKINERSQRVSVDVVEKLKQALVAETRRRCDAEKDRERAMGIIYQLLEKIKLITTDVDAVGAVGAAGAMSAPVEVPREPVRAQPPPSARALTPPAPTSTQAHTPTRGGFSLFDVPSLSPAAENTDVPAAMSAPTPTAATAAATAGRNGDRAGVDDTFSLNFDLDDDIGFGAD